MGRVVLLTDERFLDHDTGRGHPERPARVPAVLQGIERAGLAEAVLYKALRSATILELGLAHDEAFLGVLERFCAAGGGNVDPDTVVVPASWDAALAAAGAGLTAIEALDCGEGDAAFCAVRPPGHHATFGRSMGFCLLNNVAVTARALVARGERVLIVDWDAHHGNGTQEIFYDDDQVLFVSLHQYPLWPGTGAARETGSGNGAGYTMNVPFLASTSGDAYRAAIDDLVIPAAERFQPTWVLLSAGFDSHRADPLTDLGLTAGDYVDLTHRVVDLVRPGHRIAFLEGGYDLDALAASAGACVGALAGEMVRPERVSAGDLGLDVVRMLRERHPYLVN